MLLSCGCCGLGVGTCLPLLASHPHHQVLRGRGLGACSLVTLRAQVQGNGAWTTCWEKNLRGAPPGAAWHPCPRGCFWGITPAELVSRRGTEPSASTTALATGWGWGGGCPLLLMSPAPRAQSGRTEGLRDAGQEAPSRKRQRGGGVGGLWGQPRGEAGVPERRLGLGRALRSSHDSHRIKDVSILTFANEEEVEVSGGFGLGSELSREGWTRVLTPGRGANPTLSVPTTSLTKDQGRGKDTGYALRWCPQPALLCGIFTRRVLRAAAGGPLVGLRQCWAVVTKTRSGGQLEPSRQWEQQVVHVLEAPG